MIITTIENIPPELSVSPSFLERILSVLKKTGGVLAFLPIKIGAIDLHNLNLNREKYPQFNANMIPKPLGVKKKSEVDAFIHVDQAYVDKLNAKLIKQNNHTVRFSAIDLSYPITHLGHLIKTNSIKIEHTDMENKILHATQSGGNFLYKISLPKTFDMSKINDLEYLMHGPEQFVYLTFHDGSNQPVKVLGMQAEGLNDNYWPIFSDLDAHSYSEKSKSNNNNNAEIFYDTSNEEDWRKLLEAVTIQIQTNPLLREIQNEKSISAEDMVSRTMGQIRVSEVIANFLFNVSVGRYHPALNLIQHGSTLDLSPDQAFKVNKKIKKTGVETSFPKIDEKTKVGVLCPNGKLIYCEGIEVVLLYQIMNEHEGYQFPIQSWNYSTEFSREQIQQYKQNIYEELLEGGVLENKKGQIAAVNTNDFSMERPEDVVIEMPLLNQGVQISQQQSGFFSNTLTRVQQQGEIESANTHQRCCRSCVLV